jgi:GT2 family glycosyltransferase
MIPTHDCARFLRTTLAGVLAQAAAPDDMQICVVDDHSTADDPAAVVAELAGDRVEFVRQPENVGHSRNFNTCWQRARGSLVHILHGDDVVLPGFYDALAAHFAANAALGAAFCRQIVIDENGNRLRETPLLQATAKAIPDAANTLATNPLPHTPAMVVRRSVYEHLGGFDESFAFCSEDFEMWVRIAAHYPVAYDPRPLVLYRQHPDSLTSRSFATAGNLRDLRAAIEKVRPFLTPLAWRGARRGAALWGTRVARRLMSAGAVRPALLQLRETLRLSASPRVLARAAFAMAYLPLGFTRNRGRN